MPRNPRNLKNIRRLAFLASRFFCGGTIGFLLLFSSPAAFAFQNKSVPEQYEVNEIVFKVDGTISKDVYRGLIQTVETPARFWTYLYNNVYRNIGSKPVYYDPVLFQGDVMRLRQYLRDNGFSHAVVDTSLLFDSEDKRVDLRISIQENRRSVIDTLSVIGLDSLPPAIKKEVYDGLLVKQGSPFVKVSVEQERLRVLRILLNNGYTYAGIDSVTAVRYYSTDNYSVKFWYRPGERYVFGSVAINLNQWDVDSTVVIRELDFTPGQVYSEEKKMESEQNLNHLGLFESVKIESQTPLDTVVPPAIPIRILLRSRELQEVTPEFLIDDENSTLNTGLGIGYNHRNFYGDARSLSARMRFRLESIDNLDLAGVFKEGLNEPSLLTTSDLQMQMVQPYFFSNKTSASWTVSTQYEKQVYYSLNTLRNRIGFSDKFSTNTIGFADWNLERVGVTISDTTKVNPADFTGTREKQFNSIVTLTLQQDKTNDVFSPSLGFFRSISVEEAGLIPKLLNSFGSGLPYSEYYKVEVQNRYYFSNGGSKSVVWAFRLHGGVAELFDPGNNTPVPPTRKFYAGGNGSIRGWKSFDLAAFDNPAQGGNVILEGNIETRINLFPESGKLLFLNLDNILGVMFVDAGNLWNGLTEIKGSSVAIAAGTGLRYATFVGPLRFDLGFRVYDPKEKPSQQWIFKQKFFTGSFSIVQVGIGQAF